MNNKEATLIERLRNIFVSTEVFNLRLTPLEKIVYGASGLVGLTVIGALLALLFKK